MFVENDHNCHPRLELVVIESLVHNLMLYLFGYRFYGLKQVPMEFFILWGMGILEEGVEVLEVSDYGFVVIFGCFESVGDDYVLIF